MPDIQELFQDTVDGFKKQGYIIRGGGDTVCYLNCEEDSIKVIYYTFEGHRKKLKEYYEKGIENVIHVAFTAPASSREEKEQYPGLKQKVIDALSSQGYERKDRGFAKDEAEVTVRYRNVIEIKLERYSSKTVRENLEASRRRDEAVRACTKQNIRKLEEPFDV